MPAVNMVRDDDAPTGVKLMMLKKQYLLTERAHLMCPQMNSSIPANG